MYLFIYLFIYIYELILNRVWLVDLKYVTAVNSKSFLVQKVMDQFQLSSKNLCSQNRCRNIFEVTMFDMGFYHYFMTQHCLFVSLVDFVSICVFYSKQLPLLELGNICIF